MAPDAWSRFKSVSDFASQLAKLQALPRRRAGNSHCSAPPLLCGLCIRKVGQGHPVARHIALYPQNINGEVPSPLAETPQNTYLLSFGSFGSEELVAFEVSEALQGSPKTTGVGPGGDILRV